AGRHHLTGAQGHADLRQLVDQPRQRDARVAEDVRADAFAFKRWRPQEGRPTYASDHAVRSEIDRPPGIRRRGSEYELVRARVVRDQLRGADAGEVVVAGIGNLYG